MEKCLLIKWRSSEEYIFANLGHNPRDNEIPHVTVYYTDPDRTLICKTTSQRKINNDNSQRIIIQCKMESNQDIIKDQDNIDEFGPPEDWYWGAWTITVAGDLNSAVAVWNDDNQEYNDVAIQCTVLPQELFKRSGLEFVLKSKREQAQFRKSLFRLDRSCAITRESTRAVIDAAHIIEKFDTGTEVLKNGILLWTDIHRLYDARRFDIRQNGSIEICGSVSEEYRKILEQATVSQNIISRISEALAERARLQKGR